MKQRSKKNRLSFEDWQDWYFAAFVTAKVRRIFADGYDWAALNDRRD